jgi:RNase P subunit RPR2
MKWQIHLSEISPAKLAFLAPELHRTKCDECQEPLNVMQKFIERDGRIVHVTC